MKKGTSKKRAPIARSRSEFIPAAVRDGLVVTIENLRQALASAVEMHRETCEVRRWAGKEHFGPRPICSCPPFDLGASCPRMVDLLDEETKVKVEETAPSDVGLEEQCAEIVTQWARGFPAGVDDPAALVLQMDGWLTRLEKAVASLSPMAASCVEKSAFEQVQDLAAAFKADDFKEIRALMADTSLHEILREKLGFFLRTLGEAKTRIIDIAASCQWCAMHVCVCRFFKSDTEDTPAWLQGARFLADEIEPGTFDAVWDRLFGEDRAIVGVAALDDDLVAWRLYNNGRIAMIAPSKGAILVQDDKSKLPPEAR